MQNKEVKKKITVPKLYVNLKNLLIQNSSSLRTLDTVASFYGGSFQNKYVFMIKKYVMWNEISNNILILFLDFVKKKK